MPERIVPGQSDRCWRAPACHDLIMFQGHHDHAFIPHFHEVATVVLVTRGAYELTLDDKCHVVEAGTLVFIGAKQIHAARPATKDGWAMRTLHVPPELLAADGLQLTGNQTISFTTPLLEADSAAASLFLRMHRKAGSSEDARRQADQISDFVAWFRPQFDMFAPRIVQHEAPDTLLQHAKQLVQQAAFSSTLIDEIAEELGISTFSLIRRFKKAYGISPHAWRMQIRANEAAKLLFGGTDLAEVAVSCGFSDQPHFTRVFKRVFGVTPGQYSHAITPANEEISLETFSTGAAGWSAVGQKRIKLVA
jgi:AraC-like DNA-binding protein